MTLTADLKRPSTFVITFCKGNHNA